MSSIAERGVEVHPTAIVSGDVRLGAGARVGPGCVLDGEITIGENVRLVGSVQVMGPAWIGSGTIVYPFACLGLPAQDYKVKLGDATLGVRIGSNCILREHVTVHAATRPERATTIGDDVFMMVGAHAAHDVLVGNRSILVNACALAGHVETGERANIAAGSLVHQFCRIGRLAMLSGNTTMVQDIPAFCLGAERNTLHGLNVVGMRRAGMAREDITLMRAAFRDVVRVTKTRADIIEGLRSMGGGHPLIDEWVRFYETSKRGVAPSAALPPRYLRSWLKRVHEMAEDEGEDGDGLA